MRRLLEVRRGQPAFSPFGTQQVENLDDRVFAVRRGTGTPDELLCVTNVTGSPVRLPGVGGYDVVSGTDVESLELDPWGYVWLRST
jgi:sucrose phosphorylase